MGIEKLLAQELTGVMGERWGMALSGANCSVVIDDLNAFWRRPKLQVKHRRTDR